MTTESNVLPTPVALNAPGAHLRIPSVQEAIDSFLRAVRLEVRPATVSYYEKSLRPLLALNKPVADVTLDDLRRVYGELVNRKTRWVDHPGRPAQDGPLSPWSLSKYVRAWKRFFRWLCEEELILHDPAIRLKKPKLPARPPKDCMPEDLDKLIAEAERTSARDLAIVLLLADSACRVGGLVGLKLSDVELAAGRAVVCEKGERSRFVYFGPRTQAALETYLAIRPGNHGDHVFVGRRGALTAGGVHQVLKSLADRAGVTGRCNPHSLRHAWARRGLEATGDLKAVSQLLGHSSVSVTAASYAFYLEPELREKHKGMSWVK